MTNLNVITFVTYSILYYLPYLSTILKVILLSRCTPSIVIGVMPLEINKSSTIHKMTTLAPRAKEQCCLINKTRHHHLVGYMWSGGMDRNECECRIYLKVIRPIYLFFKYVVGYSRNIAYKTYYNLVPKYIS